MHDNGPAHQSLVDADFLTKMETVVLIHPLNSPYLSSCDYFLFPEQVSHLQSHRFQSSDEVKCALQAELKDIAENGFQKCFDDIYN